MASSNKRRASSSRKVALLIETSRGFGRQLLAGIARYSHLHGPWSFYITPGDFDQVVPRMREWDGDGIIARVADEKVAAAVLEANVPTLLLGLGDKKLPDDSPLRQFGQIRGASRKAAAIAAEHLLERCFRHYAYVGLAGRGYSLERERGFRERIQAAGFDVHVFQPSRRKADRVWEIERPRLAEWIRSLPKPVGLMACNDDRGREVLDACQLADVVVPEDVSVVGVDNDELFCDLADPPLSSVAFNAELGGYQAAELLDRMMRRRFRRPPSVLVEPQFVVTRRSSDAVALDDREVAAALSFIHTAQGRQISVGDVADHLAVSRRHIEVKFRNTLGRTILSEIQRVRLTHAQRLLEQTDYAIPKVAELAGYNSASYLITVFREKLELTPAQYRRHHRI